MEGIDSIASEFVILAKDSADQSMSLDGQMSVLTLGQSELQLLAGKIGQAANRCSSWQACLVEQNSRLEKLRDRLIEQQSRLESERARGKAALEEIRLALESERTQRRKEIEQLRVQHEAEMESERNKLSAKLESLEAQQKQLGLLSDCSERQADRMVEAVEELSSDRLRQGELVRRLQQEVRQLKDQLREKETELANRPSDPAEEKRQQQKSADPQSLVDLGVISEEARQFESMAARELSLLEEHEELKARLQLQAEEQRKMLAEAQRLQEAFRAAEMQHQMELQSVRKSQQFKDTKLQSAERQVQELKATVKRLSGQEARLTQRAAECEQTICQVLSELDLVRSQTAALREKEATRKEALKDYAEKMKLKASAEFELRQKIRDLTSELEEAKGLRHSV